MRRRLQRLAAALALGGAALLAPAATDGKDMGSLYDDAELRHWQPRYRDSILWNVENVILPKLTAKERRKFAKVRFEFPLRGSGNDSSAFYSTTGASPRVFMPVLSLKNFDDMSVALAWL